MSVSKWAWEAWKCEGGYCVGECDLCSKAEDYFCDECTNDIGERCSDCAVFKDTQAQQEANA